MLEPRGGCKQPVLHVRLPLVWVRLGVALHAVVYCVASANHVLGHVTVAESLLLARPACESPIVPRLIELQHFDPNGYHIAPRGAPGGCVLMEGYSGTLKCLLVVPLWYAPVQLPARAGSLYQSLQIVSCEAPK